MHDPLYDSLIDYKITAASAKEQLSLRLKQALDKRESREQALTRNWQEANRTSHHTQAQVLSLCNASHAAVLNTHGVIRDAALERSERFAQSLQREIQYRTDKVQSQMIYGTKVDTSDMRQELLAAKTLQAQNATMAYVAATAPIIEQHKELCIAISTAFAMQRESAKLEYEQSLKEVKTEYTAECDRLNREHYTAVVARLEQWLMPQPKF